MGCLVTDQIEFDAAEDLPPQILETDPAHNRVLVVDLDQYTSTMSSLPFQLTVREENLEQPIEMRVLISGRLLGDKLTTIPAAPPLEDRVHDFLLEPLLHFGLPGQCYPVEVFVSGRFLEEPGATPVKDGDIDSVVFWISTVDSTHRVVDMTACPL